jgi:hypothetical protein
MAALIEWTRIRRLLRRMIAFAERTDLRLRLWKSRRSVARHGAVNIHDL